MFRGGRSSSGSSISVKSVQVMERDDDVGIIMPCKRNAMTLETFESSRCCSCGRCNTSDDMRVPRVFCKTRVRSWGRRLRISSGNSTQQSTRQRDSKGARKSGKEGETSHNVRVNERSALVSRQRKISPESATESRGMLPCTLDTSSTGSRRCDASLQNSEFGSAEPQRWTCRARDSALRAERAEFRYHSGRRGAGEKSTEKEIGQG